MAKKLVIVESPAKEKTINKILGRNYKVLASMGHLVDLPKSDLGVDVDNDFKTRWIVMRAKQKQLTKLKKEAEKKEEIYIATDPDREGEAIGWNIVSRITAEGKQKVFRVTFQEITKDAVKRAFDHPQEFDLKKIDAQVARRVLDRIVGYQISPLLWKKVGSRLSAGRVQSVALRLIVDREREIQQFVPQEYWQIAVDLQKDGRSDLLTASLDKINGEKFELKNSGGAEDIVAQIKKESFAVSDVIKKEIRRNAPPPFITSTLQQEAFNKLGFNADRTMRAAQQLYEGMDLGDGEAMGLITYMRTDSVNISQEAIVHVRDFIKAEFGQKYLPDTPNKFKSKKAAQEAHEAIRPTDVMRRPDAMRQFLDDDQFKIYELIWKRFVACQMAPAVFENVRLEIQAGKFLFVASGSTLVFDGFLTLKIDSEEENGKADLSPYAKNDALKLQEVKPTQHFTKPPARYSEATLVKALEEDGIGRPSTYAAIIQTIVLRNYVTRERGYFTATELGMKVCDLLVQYFPHIMDIGFTAQMEENLDLVEEGDLNYVKLLRDFYSPFKQELDFAMANVVKTQEFVDKHCPECGAQMVIKWGRRGKFLSCSGFPKCKFAEPITTGIKCPQDGCDGELVARKSRGRSFYGCSRYPKCMFTSNKLPGENSPDNGADANAGTPAQ